MCVDGKRAAGEPQAPDGPAPMARDKLMYSLDLSTCSPADIIRRSIVCHPSLYAEALEAATRAHRQAAATMRHHAACAAAERLAKACNAMALILHDYGADGSADTVDLIIEGGPDYWISALNVARPLQALASWMAAEAVTRYPQGR